MPTVGTNSYISLDDFQSWALLFGNDISAYTDEQIESSTVRTALTFIDPTYTFKGAVIDEAQSMELPTDEVAIVDVNNAAAQAVWQDLKGFLFVDMTTQSINGDIASESKSIGSLKKSVEYVDGSSNSTTFNTSIIDSLLRPFLDQSQAGFNSLRVL
ncbi:hypothetical protein OAA60_03460 [Porticoccaceae bacterium]|nr:hypothetical protein [Porticoccaceae bacterium]